MENLRRWLRGEAGRQTEQQLEKAAVNDPFLADALEGYRQFPEGDHEAALGRIRNRLQQRTGERKGGFVLWRIAAAVVFVIIAGGVFWMVNDRFALENKDMAFEPAPAQSEESMEQKALTDSVSALPETLTSVESKTADPGTAPADPAKGIAETRIERPVADKPTLSEIKAPSPIALADEKRNAPPPPAHIVDGVPMKDADVAQGEIAVADEAKKPDNTVKETEAFTWADLEDEFEKDTLNVIPPEERQYIIGTILAENDDPMNGVNVSALGTQLTTMTNIRGQFKLKWQADIEKLEFYYNGYEKTLANVQGPGTLSVKMTQLADLELSEVTLTTEPVPAAAKAKKTFIGKSRVQPVGGYDALKKYVRQNKLKPEGISSGEVLLQFVVQSDGSLTSIKALQSTAKSLEAEAIRLLTQGPPWENPTNGPEVVEHVIKF